MGNRKTKLLRAQMNFLHHQRLYQSVSKSVEPNETDWKFTAKIRSEDDVYPGSVADWFMDEVCKGGAGWGLLGQREKLRFVVAEAWDLIQERGEREVGGQFQWEGE